MKHLFVVHSNITYLSALGVIERDGLDVDHCVLISYDYARQTPVPVVFIPSFGGWRRSGFNPRLYFCPSTVIDNNINRLCNNEPFVLYISIANILARHCITHRFCGEYHFLEEGLSAYRTTFALRDITSSNIGATSFRNNSFGSRLWSMLFALRGYNSKLAAIPVFYNGHPSIHRRYYGFAAESHLLVDESLRVVTDMGRIAQRFDFEYEYDLTSSRIWVGDVPLECDKELYLSMEEVVAKECLAGGDGPVFVKFHYRQPQSMRERELAVFKRCGVSFEVIPDNVILEIELLRTRSATLYGTYSSLLLYAALAGNSAFSVDKYYKNGCLDDCAPHYWTYVKRLSL